MNDLTLRDNIVADDSVIIIPVKNRSGKKSTGNVDVHEDSEGTRPAGPKKKKRYGRTTTKGKILISRSCRLLGKKPVVTEDEIERVADAVDRVAGNVPPRRFRTSGGR
jgi:hypothetical protein